MNKVYCAVDIGKMGAIGFIYKDGSIGTYKMPMIKTELDYPTLSDLLWTGKLAAQAEGTTMHVTFEKLGVIFGSGKNVAFSMGQQSGAVEALCIAHKIPYSKVRAVDWQKQMFVGVENITRPSSTKKSEVRDTKAMALVAVKRLFPELKLTFGEKAEKPHDGLIDAVLMCEWAKRNNL